MTTEIRPRPVDRPRPDRDPGAAAARRALELAALLGSCGDTQGAAAAAREAHAALARVARPLAPPRGDLY